MTFNESLSIFFLVALAFLVSYHTGPEWLTTGLLIIAALDFAVVCWAAVNENLQP